MRSIEQLERQPIVEELAMSAFAWAWYYYRFVFTEHARVGSS